MKIPRRLLKIIEQTGIDKKIKKRKKVKKKAVFD
jgi:hypothetical protein